MTVRSFVLTDSSQKISLDQFSAGPSDDLKLAGSKDWWVAKQTLKGGLSAGVEVVELHNGALSLSILPTRGMGIWKGICRGIPLGWDSPVKQPVHPGFVNAVDRNGLGWLAGFNEL